jgi:hypothetical protein
MEQNDRFGLWVRGVEPVVNIAVGAEGADDAGTGRRGDGVALGTDGNLAIVADPHVGAPAPDEGPPGTGRSWAEQAAVVSEGLGFSSVRRGAEFAVAFVFVGVGHQLVEPGVGRQPACGAAAERLRRAQPHSRHSGL